ncbi:MAG: hemerythrin domain-containing protein [Ignavibacteriae bacterium]|nr:hemerythrin domain-containing protein [Ignavibacteriota bacterium]
MIEKRNIDPIARFMQEHDVALVKLSMLNKATRSIAEHGYSEDAYAKILLALEFIDDEVSVHNKSEEEALFPVLERYVEGPTQLMRQDHKILKKEFVLLRKAVGKVGRRKNDRKAGKELHDIAKHIVQLFVNHIHKENHILFPLVQKFLTRDALREVARRMV